MYNKISWQYVAGFFDGEGSLGTYNEKHKRIMITLTQSEKQCDVLFVVQDFLEENGIFCKVRINHDKRETRDGCRQLYICNQNDALLFLKKIQPYLIVKANKANEVVKYIESRIAIRAVPGWRRTIKLSVDQLREMHQLWKDGVSQERLAKMFGLKHQVYVSRLLHDYELTVPV